MTKPNNLKHQINLFFIVFLCPASLLLAGCGGSESEPAAQEIEEIITMTEQEALDAEIDAAMEEAAEFLKDVDAVVIGNEELEEVLDTAIEIIEATPEPTAAMPELPTPLTVDGRTFRYSSLNITLDSWQLIADTTSDGTVCQADGGDFALALNVTLENSVDQPYIVEPREMQLIDAAGEPVNFFTESRFASATVGEYTNIEVPPLGTISDTLCSGISADDDPLTLTWVLGESNDRQHTEISLDANSQNALTFYSEIALNEQFSFKGAEFTISEAAVTTGVWGQTRDEGQATVGNQWLYIEASVLNNTNPTLFIEEDEVRLNVGGERIAPTYTYYDLYKLAPYGMAKDTTSKGGVLFEIPLDADSVVLNLTSERDGFNDSIEIPIRLPNS